MVFYCSRLCLDPVPHGLSIWADGGPRSSVLSGTWMSQDASQSSSDFNHQCCSHGLDVTQQTALRIWKLSAKFSQGFRYGRPPNAARFSPLFHLSSREDKHMDIGHIRESILLRLELSGWPEFWIALHIALNGWKGKLSPHVACLNFSHSPNSWWLKQ